MSDEEEFVRNFIQGFQTLPSSWALPIVGLATLLLMWLSWQRLPGADQGGPNLRFWAVTCLAIQFGVLLLLT